LPDATYKFINSFDNLSPIANKSENPVEVGKDFELLHSTLKITGITSKIYELSTCRSQQNKSQENNCAV